MAITVTSPSGNANPHGRSSSLDPMKYMSLANYLSVAGKPDNISALHYIYGDEAVSGVSGILEAVGAVNRAGTQDTVDWWEKTRRHFSDVPASNGAIAAVPANEADSMLITFSAAHRYIKGDKVLIYIATDGSKAPITATVTNDDASSNGLAITVYPDTVWPEVIGTSEVELVTKFGADFAQGTNQPTVGLVPNVSKYSQSYFILKTMFPATGSQLTNIQWVTDPVTGDDRWVYFGDKENSVRTQDYKEMMMTVGNKITNANVTALDLNGSESLFSAVSARGINTNGPVDSLAELEDLIFAFDGQAGQSNMSGGDQRIFFAARKQRLQIDDMVASLNGAAGFGMGVLGAPSFGAFSNGQDMAVKLGFTSFTRGGYTFHMKDYKLLNDPTLLGNSIAKYYKGVIFPLATYSDPKTGQVSSMLEISEKAYGSYNRGMEEFVIGAANGVYNHSDGFDGLLFHKRSESALVVKGANNIALIKGSTT